MSRDRRRGVSIGGPDVSAEQRQTTVVSPAVAQPLLNHLVAVVEGHVAEDGQLGLQTLGSDLMVALFSVKLLPDAPSLVDGLHHGVLVSKQHRGVQAGQDV